MLPLRFPWLWLFLGWAMVLAVCAGSLLPGDEFVRLPVGDKLLHAGSYFLLMIWFGGLYERRRHVFIAAILIGLGVLLDVLQGSVSRRHFDLMDIAANAGGILIGLSATFWLLTGWCQRVERRLFA